ncbi:MAG TPA: hypothetical protein VF721_21345 [Pyrinomonadaceae bacterium]|jgi:hypothetical protein
MKILFCIAIILNVFLIAQAQAVKNETINLSRGGAARIDGKIEEKEWQDASAFELSNGGRIYLKYDGEFLYVGVRGVKAGWSHLYLSEGDGADVSVIHASAALGKSLYKQDKNKMWQPANEFFWELRDRVITAETEKKMDDYLSKNRWVASNNNMGNPTEIEFKVKPQNAVNNPFRFAVVYVADGVSPQFFPATLADDTLKSRLLTGYTPPDVKFDFS